MKNKLQTILCFLSIAAWNPWGASIAQRWTLPKFFAICLLVILNLLSIEKSVFKEWKTKVFVFHRQALAQICLAAFLIVGLISTLSCDRPLSSFWGPGVFDDCLFYWIVIFMFVVSNILAGAKTSQLFEVQSKGFIWGGIVLALSIFPQVVNWKIDYTSTSGSVLGNYDILQSFVGKEQMPIGLFSHRGHAAVALAFAGVLGVVAILKGWMEKRVGVPALLVIVTALIMTKTRVPLFGFLIGASFLLIRGNVKLFLPLVLLVVMTISVGKAYFIRNPATEVRLFNSSTSERSILWRAGVFAFSKRPWFGWGFNGFGSGNANTADELWQRQGIRVIPPSFSAHNAILDLLVSVGILGTFFYVSFLVLSLWLLFKQRQFEIMAVWATYFIFTLFWYESAQYSHLGVWCLTLVGPFSTKS